MAQYFDFKPHITISIRGSTARETKEGTILQLCINQISRANLREFSIFGYNLIR